MAKSVSDLVELWDHILKLRRVLSQLQPVTSFKVFQTHPPDDPRVVDAGAPTCVVKTGRGVPIRHAGQRARLPS